VDVDDGKQCLFVEPYGGNTQHVLANLSRLNGNIEANPKYGVPVNLFVPKGARKYWVKASTPVMGSVHCVYYINAIHLSIHSVAGISCSWSWTRSFVRSWSGTLSLFEMPIWHPTSEKALDELLKAKVDV
jgi:hypothetical protein